MTYRGLFYVTLMLFLLALAWNFSHPDVHTGFAPEPERMLPSKEKIIGEKRLEKGIIVTQQKLISPDEWLVEFHIPSPLLPAYEWADRICLLYKNTKDGLVDLYCVDD